MNRRNAKSQTVVVAVLGLVLLLGAAEAQAASVFSTFGPGDSFNAGSLGSVGGPTAIVEFSAGASFTPSGNATLVSIDYASSFFSGTNSLIIKLLGSDSGGLPDESNVLESWTSVAGDPTADVRTVTSVLDPTLVSGTQYWVALFPGASDTFIGWNDNDQGVLGGRAFTQNSGPWTAQPSFAPTPAFRVNGTAAGPVIPLPASAWMGLSMLGALFVLGRRKKRLALTRVA